MDPVATGVLGGVAVSGVRRENWRSVDGGVYEVSDIGRVRRALPGKGSPVGHILSPIVSTSGYWTVTLSQKPKVRVVAVHILVAEAFLGPRPERHDVNHIDGDRLNNKLKNLEYVTRTGNMQHAARLGLLRRKTTADEVRQMRAMALTGMLHREIAKKFRLSRPQTSKIIAGLSWRHV
jgi:hypothetical protein